MCLGIPGRVVGLADGYADQLALVDVEGARRQVNVGMLEAPPGPGDWVLIHMGFAVELIDEARPGRRFRPGADGQRTGSPGPAPLRRVRRRAGRRLPAVRLRAGRPARPHRVGGQHRRRGRRRGRGRPRRGGRLRPPAAPRTHRRSPSSRTSHDSDLPVRGGTGFTIGASTAGRWRAHPGLAGRRRVRGLPARAARPGRPPLPAPVRHLHQLRPAVHHHHRPALRPGDHHDGATSRCARTAPSSTPTPPTAASTPSRSPAPTAARGSSCCGPRRGTLADGDGALAAGPRELLAAGGRPGGQGPRRLPPGLRRAPTTGGRRAARDASAAATSRSR